MSFHLALTVLKSLRKLYITNPSRLTDSEQAIAKRILVCTSCDNYWIKKTKITPKRCPACHRTSWDRPLIQLMTDMAPAPDEGEKGDSQ